MPPATTLQQLIALLSTHSWLPLIALATLYLRKILSPASGFPISIPPRWLPVVTSAGALTSGLVSSLQTGESAGAAILGVTVMAASGGFLDGVLTAIFDHDNAPSWARAIVFVFDDIGGGGSGGNSAKRAMGGAAFGHPKEVVAYNPVSAEAAKQSAPTASLGYIGRLAVAVAVVASLIGCSWLQSPQGVATVQGGIDLAVCVLNHSNEPISQIVTDCGASTAEDVIKILDAHRAATVREMSVKDGGQ